ncbi:MAG: hypothetical protein M3R70_05445 [Actinomycetota bacterium]|nr:hypothetical protein [Actinomycetota bacterium]
MQPRAEFVHWMFASGVLALGLFLLAEAVVGQEVWRRRTWRTYLWPSSTFLIGVWMWPVMVFYTNSAIHMLAHGAWAQMMMLSGAAELGLVRGKLSSPYWKLTTAVALPISGAAFLIHEQNGWIFSRAAFLHHVIGWTLVASAVFALGRAVRPRSVVPQLGFALVAIVLAISLYSDRDVSPIFGHISPRAGTPHR